MPLWQKRTTKVYRFSVRTLTTSCRRIGCYPAIIRFLGYVPFAHDGTVASKARWLRMCAGWNQEELAAVARCNVSTVGRWKNNRAFDEARWSRALVAMDQRIVKLGLSELQMTARRDVLRRNSLQAAELNKTVSSALAGQTVGTVVEGNHRHDVVVRMPETLRANDAEIQKLPVRIVETGLLPLGKFVEFKSLRTVEPIQRDAGQRRAALMVNLKTRDIEGYVREAERHIQEQVRLPEGYFVEFGGQFENLQKARTRLAVVVPSALAIIFVLIFLAFRSVRQALLVYSGIPLAVTGGVAALWLRGMPFSITAAVGFIALAGVAVLNGMVLVNCFNQLREEGGSVPDAVREGALARVRPVLMTAAVASLGFVPMALATGPGAEVQRPLATVVIGGIISSTFLTLVLLPVLYAWTERKPSAHVKD